MHSRPHGAPLRAPVDCEFAWSVPDLGQNNAAVNRPTACGRSWLTKCPVGRPTQLVCECRVQQPTQAVATPRSSWWPATGALHRGASTDATKLEWRAAARSLPFAAKPRGQIAIHNLLLAAANFLTAA